MKNKINKALNLMLLLSMLNSNILSMQKSDIGIDVQPMEINQSVKQELSLLGLPAEVINYIICQIVKPYEDKIKGVNNVFDYCQLDLKPLVSNLSGVSLTSKGLRFWTLDLINRLKKLKKNKYQELVNQIKEQYQGISEDELNSKLRNILNQFSVNRNDLEVATKLILAGANVNEKNHGGYTVLMWATFTGHKDIVQLLIDNGANVNEKNNNSDTALMLATFNDHKGIVQLLIANDANVNEKNNYGDTALMVAARNGHEEIVQLLIYKGANVNEKNNRITALMLAEVLGHKNIVELLEATKNNENQNNSNN